MFKVDYVVEAAGNKEFGSVFLQQGTEKENVAVSVVQNGWAKVGGAAGGVYQQQGACTVYRWGWPRNTVA